MEAFTIRWDKGWVEVDAMINRQPSQGKVFEGWFVDEATGYRRSISKLAENET